MSPSCFGNALQQVQRCTLLSIKTGGCPETCTYCSQSSSWSKSTGMKAEKLMDLEEVYQVTIGGPPQTLPQSSRKGIQMCDVALHTANVGK
jgi:hypothetical protein